MDDAGDVAHHVEPAVGGDRAEDEVFHVGARRRVAPDRGGLAAVGEDLVGGLGRALDVDVGAHDGGPDAREHAHARGADPAARAGDHRHPAGEVEAVARIVHDASSASRTAPPKATARIWWPSSPGWMPSGR